MANEPWKVGRSSKLGFSSSQSNLALSPESSSVTVTCATKVPIGSASLTLASLEPSREVVETRICGENWGWGGLELNEMGLCGFSKMWIII